MTTTIQEQNGDIIVALAGRLDTPAAAKVEKDMQPLYNYTGRDIILDCKGLEYISSSGLRLFLKLVQRSKTTGNHVYITGANASVQNVFTVTGFVNLFDFK